MPSSSVRVALQELGDRGLIVPVVHHARGEERYELTERGGDVMTRLIEARRARLAAAASDWNPVCEPVAAAYLKGAVRSILPAIRRAS